VIKFLVTRGGRSDEEALVEDRGALATLIDEVGAARRLALPPSALFDDLGDLSVVGPDPLRDRRQAGSPLADAVGSGRVVAEVTAHASAWRAVALVAPLMQGCDGDTEELGGLSKLPTAVAVAAAPQASSSLVDLGLWFSLTSSISYAGCSATFRQLHQPTSVLLCTVGRVVAAGPTDEVVGDVSQSARRH
jgi:hypothetical protein